MTNNKISLSHTVHHINTKLTLDTTALSVADDNNIAQRINNNNNINADDSDDVLLV